MTDILSFDTDPALRARFLDVEARVYADDPVHGAGPPSRDEALLEPGARDVPGNAAHRSFLATSDGDDVGRITAIVPADLVVDGKRAGMLGYFACVDDARVGRPLLDAALAHLRAQGVQRVLGPLNFSTWYGYRFAVEGFENGRFVLEPHHKPGYAQLFVDAGFEPLHTYASVRMPTAQIPVLARLHQRALAAGVVFEPLEAQAESELLPILYDVACTAFQSKAGYSQIARARFEELYAGMGALLTPGLSHLARDGRGVPVGFVFALPDYLEPLRTGRDAITTVVVKTLAIVPGAPRFLGGALAHVQMQAAREQGFTEQIWALMEKWRQALQFVTPKDASTRLHKRYALFARDLEGAGSAELGWRHSSAD
jgi:hypothetical protein